MGGAFSAIQVPLIENSIINGNNSSSHSNTNTCFGTGLNAGIEAWPFRGPHYGFGAAGNYAYALNYSGGSVSVLDLKGTFIVGFKSIKTVWEYGFGSRVASTFSDSYAYNFSETISGNASYKYTRLGVGLQYDFSDYNDDAENTLTAMILFDRPEFLPTDQKGFMVGKLIFKSFLDFYVEYSKNYAIGGDKKYIWDSGEPGNKDYFFIGFGKTFTIIGGKY